MNSQLKVNGEGTSVAPRVMSMTGFAPVQGSHNSWIWSGDIRAVNGKSLDLRLRLPEIDGLEAELRKRCKARIGRGNVTVQVRLTRDESLGDLRLNEAGLSNALALLSGIAVLMVLTTFATTRERIKPQSNRDTSIRRDIKFLFRNRVIGKR